jgi:hypothetical protein
MTAQPEAPQSRRQVLGAAIAGVGGLAAAVLGRPTVASADTGDNFVLGTDNTADVTTRLTMTTATFDQTPALDLVVQGDHQTGLHVLSRAGHAIRAWSNPVHPDPGTSSRPSTIWTGADSGSYALVVEGNVYFSRSGRAEIATGRSWVKVRVPGSLGRTSFAIATLNANRPGVWVRTVVVNWTESLPERDAITIILNKPTPYKARCAWMVFN